MIIKYISKNQFRIRNLKMTKRKGTEPNQTADKKIKYDYKE